MLVHPTERNVNPFMFQTGICTVKKLVLALTIHDKDASKHDLASLSEQDLQVSANQSDLQAQSAPKQDHESASFASSSGATVPATASGTI